VNEDNNMVLDDGDGQITRGNVRVESDVDHFEKDLNDLQEILNVAVDLMQYSINRNLSHATINFLLTFSVKQNISYINRNMLLYFEKQGFKS